MLVPPTTPPCWRLLLKFPSHYRFVSYYMAFVAAKKETILLIVVGVKNKRKLSSSLRSASLRSLKRQCQEYCQNTPQQHKPFYW